jgi:hypothetical protein
MDVSVSGNLYEKTELKKQAKRHSRNHLFLAPGNTYPLCGLSKNQAIVSLTLT